MDCFLARETTQVNDVLSNFKIVRIILWKSFGKIEYKFVAVEHLRQMLTMAFRIFKFVMCIT